MKIISWNVNGLRAVLKKGFEQCLQEWDADAVCLQEIKCEAGQVSDWENPYPIAYYHSAEKKGYSGTATFCKNSPLSVAYDLTVGGHPAEGRVLITEFEKFQLVNVYTPNSKNELLRLPYREQSWDPDFAREMKRLDAAKPVIICGDLNVAHQEIDLANPKTNRRNAGFTDEERAGMDNLLEAGFVDVFRQKNPTLTGAYTWWSYRGGARARNVGWRIDYFLVSQKIISSVKEVKIHPEVQGSDHCPISIELKGMA